MTLRTDFTSQEYFRNPAAGIERLRATGPVIEIKFPIIGRVWITTTQELAGRVLKESETFTLRKDGGAIAGLRWWMPGIIRAVANNMLTMDEPDHTRLRGIVDEAFRRRAILDMEPRILAIAEGLADELFAEGNPADIVDRYARRLPLAVICELLGLPAADRPKFMAWTNSFTRLTSLVGFLGLISALVAMKRYLEARLEVARDTGGEGLIAELVRVEKEGGRISAGEMVAMVFLLLAAGTETTTHLISGSVYELTRNPALRDWLEEDWTRANLAIEGFLRFISPVQFSKPRFVRKDVDLGGVQVKKGEKIMAMLAAANLDPDANQHPELMTRSRWAPTGAELSWSCSITAAAIVQPDNVAVVTGAALGIGRAMCKRFAEAGMSVVLADFPGEHLDSAVRSLKAISPQPDGILGAPTDVADAQQVQGLRSTVIARFGKVNVLANNAATRFGRGHDADLTEWRRAMDVNVWGQFWLCARFCRLCWPLQNPA